MPIDKRAVRSQRKEFRDTIERQRNELRELAWEWDPLFLGDESQSPQDEYDCIVDFALSRLHRGADTPTLAADLAGFFAEHFGASTAHRSIAEFAANAVSWFVSQATAPKPSR